MLVKSPSGSHINNLFDQISTWSWFYFLDIFLCPLFYWCFLFYLVQLHNVSLTICNVSKLTLTRCPTTAQRYVSSIISPLLKKIHLFQDCSTNRHAHHLLSLPTTSHMQYQQLWPNQFVATFPVLSEQYCLDRFMRTLEITSGNYKKK